MMDAIRSIFRRHRRAILALLAAPLVASAVFLGLDAAMPPAPRVIPPAPRPRVILPEGEAYLLEFSPDGRLLFTAGASGACIRDVATGRVRVRLVDDRGEPLGPTTELTWPRFTPDGRRLIVQVGGPRFRPDVPVTLQVFDVATGRRRASFTGVDWKIWFGSMGIPAPQYVLSADGSALAFAHGTDQAPSVLVWDVVGERVVADVPGVPPLALSADGRTLAHRVSADDLYRLAIRGVAAGRPAATFAVEHGEPRDGAPTVVAFSPDGKTLTVGHGLATELRDAATAQRRAVLRRGDPEWSLWPQAAWFSPDARLLFVENWGGHGSRAFVQWWHFDGSSWRKGFHDTPGSFTPDGRRAVRVEFKMGSRSDPLARDDCVVRVVDLPSQRERTRILATGVRDAVIAPDGRSLALATYRQEPDPPPESFRERIERLIGRRSPLPPGFGPAIGPFRDVLEVEVHEAATGRALGTIDRPGRKHPPVALTFAPDGKTLAIHETPKGLPLDVGMPTLDRSVEFWDVPPPRRPAPSAPRRPIGRILAWSALLTAMPLALGFWLDRRRSARAIRR